METTTATDKHTQARIGSNTSAAAAATEWSTPHPVAYLFRVSRATEALKPFLGDYCSGIRLVRETRDALRQRWPEDRKQSKLSLRKPSRNRSSNSKSNKSNKSNNHRNAFWIREMEALDDDERMYRAGFQLARSLWQLEGTLAKTYLALTRWRRSVEETDRLERSVEKSSDSNNDNGNDSNNDSNNDNDTDFFIRKDLLLLLKQQDAETEKSAIEYEDRGYEQASLSRDIGELIPRCDETMVDYLDANYCHCAVCNYYFSKKDLGILGLIRGRPENPDRGKHLRESARWESVVSEEEEEEEEEEERENHRKPNPDGDGEDDDDDDDDDRFDCFYCLECYKKITDRDVAFQESERERQEQEFERRDEPNADANANADKPAANAPTDSSAGDGSFEASDPDLDDPTEPTTPRHGESNGNGNGTSSSKKRRKRKKKKKASVAAAVAAAVAAPPAGGVAADEFSSSSFSSPSETKHQAAPSSLSCPSPTSVVLEYATTMTRAAANSNSNSKTETEPETEIGCQRQRQPREEGSSDGPRRSEDEDEEEEEPDAFLEAMDRASRSASGERSPSPSSRRDPNELWVDYLCRTRSIIALDRYMDEMDPLLRGGEHETENGDGNRNRNRNPSAEATNADARAAV